MKLFKRKDDKKTEQERVEERREEVLAAGRKFKYPLQWTKHRVVINTILITTVVIGIIITSGWLALYRFNMTDEMLFRVTKILPVPVAEVISEKVLFSDYLMLYRSSIISVERQSSQNKTEGSIDDLRAQYRRDALTEAEKFAYALKIANDQGITVTSEEVAEEFNRHLNIGGIERSEESFLKIISDNFGLNKGEYERILYLSLIKSKVEIEIDEKANKVAERVENMLKKGSSYTDIAKALESSIIYEETGGMVSNQNIDGGRATEAMKLEPGEQSGRFTSINGDGYYFVKLIKKTDSEVNFVSIKVPFTEFNSRFEAIREDGRVNEFINPE
ncbi:hypothetical protein IKW73_01315 [Candidatus Saccharibacteria bacterium]|nr:hypothetical protein [Candidatus Saccharibacteria bacterium]